MKAKAIQEAIKEMKDNLQVRPFNEKEAIDYLNTLHKYAYSFNQDITLNHLNIISNIAENTGYINIFTWRKEEYQYINYEDLKSFIEDFINYIEDLININDNQD